MSLYNSYSTLLTVLLFHVVVSVQPAEVVLKTAANGVPFNSFREVNKTCEDGCLELGNCNHELGECECPFGLTGPTCREQLFPACRTNSGNVHRLFLGRTAPRNCHCYLQLQRALCLPDDQTRCAFHTMQLWDALFCFEKVGAPESEQTSELPEHWEDGAFRWGRATTRREDKDGVTVEVRGIEWLPQPPRDDFIIGTTSLSKCPERCHEQGICRDFTADRPRCICFPGFGGEACADIVEDGERDSLCPAKCGDRGRCIGGFCKCEPGYWGVACSRSKAYEPEPGSVAYPYYPSLKIYMYDMPPNIVGPQQFEDGEAGVFPIYQAFLRFLELFIKDNSGIRTENPHEANLFYVPTFAYYHTSNLGDPTGAIVRAMNWVSSKYPFFNRYAGRDHFVLLMGDRGACYLKTTPQTENIIRLTHFGYETPQLSNMGRLVHNMEYGCFKGGRDIVVAPFIKTKVLKMEALRTALAEPGGVEDYITRKKVLLFFSGDIRHNEPEYSGGVRQVLQQLMANNTYPDVVFKGGYMTMGPSEYEALLVTSKFCLAPYGHGFGIRLTQALMHGCIPVIVQDRVRQPWEDILHYPDFSIRVAKKDLHRLVDVLRAVPQEDVVRMSKENLRVYRAFIWQQELGGLAYNYTIASLRRRLSFIRGELYEAGVRRA